MRPRHRNGDRKDAHPAEGQPRGKPRGEQRDDRPKDERRNRAEGKPRGKPPRNDRPPLPKPDTGPARAGGAFDKLADLLKG